MLTVIIKRNADADTVQLTQKNIIKELWNIPGSEMLVTDTWNEGLKQVRTPFVCLVEADCTLSASYLASNYGLMSKMTPEASGKGSYPDGGRGGKRAGAGGYTKLVMLSSCIGINNFGNRIYNYKLEKTTTQNYPDDKITIKEWTLQPNRTKISNELYLSQVGFVPGAIIRYNAVKDLIGKFDWDYKNLVEMSTRLSFHFWDTNRRLQVNPNTTYVTNVDYLEHPPVFDPQVPDKAGATFKREGIS